MRVAELIELLQECDPEAQVTLGHQPSYPFEYSVSGIAVREDFEEPDDDEGGYEPHGLSRGLPKSGTDVVILEGSQVSYGSREMWNAARRAR